MDLEHYPPSSVGYRPDAIRHPASWRSCIVIWYPIQWAPPYILERLPPESGSPVFSYLPLSNAEGGGYELILPSNPALPQQSLILANGMPATTYERWPEPGDVQGVRLVRRFDVPYEALLRAGIHTIDDLSELSPQLSSYYLRGRQGFSEALLTTPEASFGNVPLLESVSVTWGNGLEDPDFPLNTLYLTEENYIRIFPRIRYQSDEGTDLSYFIGRVHRPYKWPRFYSVVPFVSPPKPGETHECVIMWVMARDGRPVGHAYLPK